MPSIRFRIIENNEKTFDTDPIDLMYPFKYEKCFATLAGTISVAELYKIYKEKYPTAEITVICEEKIHETYTPMTKLVQGDFYKMLLKLDEKMKVGIDLSGL